MPKQTFTLRRRGGGTEEVSYHALMVIAGSEAHKLALHKDNVGDWVVSDPKSGAAVIRKVPGWHKGCPVSLRCATLKEAKQLALAEVDALINRVGSERFNSVLANPQPF